jgi:stage III sporulation protein AA
MEIGLEQFFPERLRGEWRRLDYDIRGVREIRIRVNMPVRILADMEYKMGFTYGDRDISDIFKYICRDSVYAYDYERRQGYMTLEGGHRIGFTGELTPTGAGEYIAKYIKYMNIRIAHEKKGVAARVIDYVYDNGLLSTLIISPPAVGKTTLLRDLIRIISDGGISNWGSGLDGFNVGVVDERGEIAGAFRGSATLYLGERTDVVTGGDKLTGIDILVRTFSPKVVAIDEIGRTQDAEAILRAKVSGCSVFATAHGRNLEDIKAKREFDRILGLGVFERFVILHEKNSDRYFEVLDSKGEIICGKSLLHQPL